MSFANSHGLATHIGRKHKLQSETCENDENDENGAVNEDNAIYEYDAMHEDNDWDNLPPNEPQNAHKYNAHNFAPYGSKLELQMAHWFVEYNVPRNAIDKMASFGVFDTHGIKSVYSAKSTSAKAQKIPQLHEELDSGSYETKKFSNLHHDARSR